jgi:hypothetical protein
MARIVPSDWRALEVTGAAAREIETLALLERSLPAYLTVLHGVHWSRIQRGFTVVGEIDFVVIAPSGRILLMEQKSGFLEETPDGLVKRYGADSRKHVGYQIDRMVDALRSRLSQTIRGESIGIDYLLYCPDYTVKDKETAGLPQERIVDLPRRDGLSQRIVEALPDQPARPGLARRLYEFFAGELDLVPDTATLVGRAEQLVTRLSGGLATWARRLDFAPFRLRVSATAGAGKTQLALAVLADAAKAGRGARYICFNRPLADHVARVAPEATQVSTFHQLCERRLRAAGLAPDFGQPDAFEELVTRYAALSKGDEQVDELVVDEGQDFDGTWVEPLLRGLKRDGRVWWLEDPMQQLYERAPVELSGWVVLRDYTNYRTPRKILDCINRLVIPACRIEAASPLEGADVEFLDYADTGELIDRTKRAITLALQGRFRKQDIAVVTFAGREKSKLLTLQGLGANRLKSFTGRYDLFGTPQYSDGEILCETVYRFKGQSAPCVILTEVDFEALDERARRKLFVGMTRASMKMFLVISRRAAEILQART